jgi:hypothetical protein
MARVKAAPADIFFTGGQILTANWAIVWVSIHIIQPIHWIDPRQNHQGRGGGQTSQCLSSNFLAIDSYGSMLITFSASGELTLSSRR